MGEIWKASVLTTVPLTSSHRRNLISITILRFPLREGDCIGNKAVRAKVREVEGKEASSQAEQR